MKRTDILNRAAALLRPVPDFPKKGILFFDISPVLRDPVVTSGLIDILADIWKDEGIDVIAGFDARGFLFGLPLALRMGLPFEQIRKKGKLPGPVEPESYKLEYGEATVEMENVGFIAGKRVLLVDDLLATGGTAMAGAKLVERLGGIVAGFTCITELPALGGRGVLSRYRVESLISIVDDVPYTDAAYCIDMYVTDSDVDDLLLIERFTKPRGYAMPGGHLEGESLVAAAVREFREETGIETSPNDWQCTGHVLAAYGRDTRGMKVSFVLKAKASLTNTRTELDTNGNPKHRLHIVKPGLDLMPEKSAFTLGHGPVVHYLWSQWLVGREIEMLDE